MQAPEKNATTSDGATVSAGLTTAVLFYCGLVLLRSYIADRDCHESTGKGAGEDCLVAWFSRSPPRQLARFKATTNQLLDKNILTLVVYFYMHMYTFAVTLDNRQLDATQKRVELLEIQLAEISKTK